MKIGGGNMGKPTQYDEDLRLSGQHMAKLRQVTRGPSNNETRLMADGTKSVRFKNGI